ncbi:winged helix-turn-helix domain-containing protein [Peredibacter starrii]|uniref:Winged helix DNA-binding domain-containing protein n=1 Tax=Peredibacter starrii TaxID=28202 RepID=A0AAX4HJ84_9BACT|nr:winged helix DNA-binding domain-containing protein [Peredibacter starrii]WPU63287.1 winged helix DNA-binding domain-containing protein [Peredibacter starrii]
MKSEKIMKGQAKALWISAQGLHEKNYFGKGPSATTKVIEHLGYVQIDTINVIERCHHHILYSRIPDYHQKHLYQAQTHDKTIFEYWTHALAYVPIKDYRFFRGRMEKNVKSPHPWYDSVKKEDLQKLFRLIKKDGPISIRDIQDDVLVEKDHAWASRKPSKKALQLGFNQGKLVISERIGMLKKYELADRHFNWDKRPKRANEEELNEYLLERALRSQAIVSLDSICHLEPSRKAAMKALIQRQIDEQDLIPVLIDGAEKVQHWMRPELLKKKVTLDHELVHILSPFDPLIIQRKRLNLFFDYQHLFEAYIPKEKRVYGYFALPILIGDKIVAVIDLKTDRQLKKLLIQKWTWLPKQKSATFKKQIETELQRFEKFQLQ